MSILVIGGAGFIGSALIERLSVDHDDIIVIDKLSLGSIANLDQSKVTFYDEDINNLDKVVQLLKNHHNIFEVWHLAANSDIPAGIDDIDVDLQDTFLSTVSVLKLMKVIECKRLFFASSSAIYGPHDERLNENTGPLFPISNYGAMKLASEAVISSYLESYLETACIYRFPNVVGLPATHGVILDFVRRLKEFPEKLDVFGDGTQQKIYIHIHELIDAMLFINKNTSSGLNFFNIGPEDNGVTVKSIAENTVQRINPNAKINYGLENRGWVGDVPKFFYSVEKLKNIGYQVKNSSLDAILIAIDEIAIQEGF
jgi:UDP-glucose 4-epimerase